MSESKFLQTFRERGALITDSHLVYTSGRHGSAYVNKDALYPNPKIISSLCEAIAKHFGPDRIEVVLAPALGGIVLTQWIAYHSSLILGTDVLAVFAEKIDAPAGFVIKRGYENLLQGQ